MAGTISNLIDSPKRRQRRHDEFMMRLGQRFGGDQSQLPMRRRVAIRGGTIEIDYDQSQAVFAFKVTRRFPSGAGKSIVLEHLGQIGSVSKAVDRFFWTWQLWRTSDTVTVQQLWDQANKPTLRLHPRLALIGR